MNNNNELNTLAENNSGNKVKKTAKRGLASADEQTRRYVARMGGKAAQMSGNAHRLTFDEQRKGGKNSPGNFANRPMQEVQEIGRKGGKASRGGGRPDGERSGNYSNDVYQQNVSNEFNSGDSVYFRKIPVSLGVNSENK